ncbi:MAG: oxidoreductase [Betaproteobacteria bacterium]|nr:oxidoreductase [Betaproteobacteria bacterium]
MHDITPPSVPPIAAVATVVASARITPETSDEVRQIVLHVDDAAFDQPAGQNLGILSPGPHPFGNPAHHRYYSIAGVKKSGLGVDLEILVRRCFYVDEVSGEQYPGEASNYLCDLAPGAQVELTGPHRSPFQIPRESDSNLLMIGAGAGIAPFRALLQRIYTERGGWTGQVRLFFGARTGADLLYMNTLNDDLALYYDQATFQAIQAIKRPLLGDEADALQQGVADHAAEVWRLLQDPRTHVYLAGLKKVETAFDAAMAQAAGSAEAWQQMRQQVIEDGRWSELTYQ